MPENRPSRSRRAVRESAFQALYMIHLSGLNFRTALETVLFRKTFASVAEKFLRSLVKGASDHLTEIDEIIAPCLSKGWTLNRLAVSDLTALRLATYELYHLPGIPPKVTIAEAVRLAEKFGNQDSASFVNGMLRTILSQSPKVEWDPSQEEQIPDLDSDETADASDEDVDVEESTDESGVQAGSWTIRAEDSQTS